MGSRAISALLLALALAAGAAPAAQDVDLATGMRQLEEGDLEGAAATFDVLIRRWAAEPGRASDLAQAHLHAGIAYLLLDNEKAAKGNFREALRQDPALRPDPSRVPPRVLRSFEAARLEFAPPTPLPSSPTPAPGPAPTPAAADAPAAGPSVVLHTSLGRIRLLLLSEEAPRSTANFLSYVRAGHYDGTIFHRVIPRFMAQAGGFDAQMTEREARRRVTNEAGNGVSNRRGTVAVARTADPDSGTAQFFINVVDNPRLDRAGGQAGYAVFARVTEGMDVVDRIVAVPTQSRGGHQNVPVTAVVILSARVEGEGARVN
jgi:peptidyl-prolyl cis-trans isomerase A (cyclophilin A)